MLVKGSSSGVNRHIKEIDNKVIPIIQQLILVTWHSISWDEDQFIVKYVLPIYLVMEAF